MATPSPSNPLGFILKREYDDYIYMNKNLLRERLKRARNLYKKDLLAHYGCVNAIEFSNKGRFLVSGGDDRRVLIWNVEKAIHGVGTPAVMKATHLSNIFCLSFDSTNSKVFSAGNDDQVIVHDVATGECAQTFIHEQPVYGLSIDPLNDSVFASACDDGRVLVYDIREPQGSEPFCLARYSSAFHAVMFNPVEPRVLTTANSKEGVALWDVRKPHHAILRYGHPICAESCMSVRFNQKGTKILALRRRLPPVLYSFHSPIQICQFDHPGYYNSCTMKSCSFAGDDDQYVLSGSDDFNLYMWKLPESDEHNQWIGSAHMILRGHRSIVNQVRFHSSNYIIASSGVEKLIKFWSPYRLPESTGSLVDDSGENEKQRKVFTHEEYINLVLRTGQYMTHDYSHQSTKEDPRMMAFFDSLVQREIEGWVSEDSHSSELSTTPFTAPIHFSSDSEPITTETADNALQGLAGAYMDALEEQVNNVYSTNNSETPSGEPLHSQNRISQLIARKRAQLMKLAKTRESKERNRRKRTKRNGVLKTSSDSNNSGPDTKVQDADTSDSDDVLRKHKYRRFGVMNGNGNMSNGNVALKSKSRFDYKRENNRKRRVKYMLVYSDSSEEEEADDAKNKPIKQLWHDVSHTNGLSTRDKRIDTETQASTSHDAQRKKHRLDSGSDSSSGRETEIVRPKRKYFKHKSNMQSSDRLSKKNSTAKFSEANMHSGQAQLLNVPQTAPNVLQNSDVINGVNLSEKHLCESASITSTPNGKQSEELTSTPDSGIVVQGCSSADSTNTEWKAFKRFRINRVRRNLRKQQEDSDSN